MQTLFTPKQLTDPDIQAAEAELRKCVHCGFCTATCPTFVLLGDELDSPRGRIHIIKDMLENDKPAGAGIVKHIDRCLSCLSCMTTCPSDVNYMRLIDHARTHASRTHDRPLAERTLRLLLSIALPRPRILRALLIAGWFLRPVSGLMPGRLKVALKMTPKSIPSPSWVDRPQVFPARGPKRKRMAIMTGCAQKVLRPSINEATVRLLNRHGVEVVHARGTECCGALAHHMGKEDAGRRAAKANIEAWMREYNRGGLDAIVVNASGCGTMVKDYGHMFRNDPDHAEKAARISALAKDIAEVAMELGLRDISKEPRPVVTYHSACSMQHGQRLKTEPKTLLTLAGFEIRPVKEEHLCCGSAGTYNIMQPEIANRLRDRKVANLKAAGGEVVATGNIGCLTQLGPAIDIPVIHTVELLDWATGGPKPDGL